jgi:hypothetical protein
LSKTNAPAGVILSGRFYLRQKCVIHASQGIRKTVILESESGGDMMYDFGQMSAQRMSITQVNGWGGADAFRMGPNSSILLLDQEQPVVYMKTTDGGGFPSVAAYELRPLQRPKPLDANELEERLNRLEALIRESVTKQDADPKSKRKPEPATAE